MATMRKKPGTLNNVLDFNWRVQRGTIVELSAYGFYKRFLWYTEIRPAGFDVPAFHDWLVMMGLSHVIVSAIGTMPLLRMNPVHKVIHYILPQDQPRMTLEMVAYYLGESHDTHDTKR